MYQYKEEKNADQSDRIWDIFFLFNCRLSHTIEFSCVLLVFEQHTLNWYSAQIQTDWLHFQNKFIDIKTVKNKFSLQKTNLFRVIKWNTNLWDTMKKEVRLKKN